MCCAQATRHLGFSAVQTQYLYISATLVVMLAISLPLDGTEWVTQLEPWSAGDWLVLVSCGSVVYVGSSVAMQVRQLCGMQRAEGHCLAGQRRRDGAAARRHRCDAQWPRACCANPAPNGARAAHPPRSTRCGRLAPPRLRSSWACAWCLRSPSPSSFFRQPPFRPVCRCGTAPLLLAVTAQPCSLCRSAGSCFTAGARSPFPHLALPAPAGGGGLHRGGGSFPVHAMAVESHAPAHQRQGAASEGSNSALMRAGPRRCRPPACKQFLL